VLFGYVPRFVHSKGVAAGYLLRRAHFKRVTDTYIRPYIRFDSFLVLKQKRIPCGNDKQVAKLRFAGSGEACLYLLVKG